MADNRKWLNKDLKSVVSKVHKDFTHKWPDHDSRPIWVNSWSNVLSVAQIKPDTVVQASEYCINHLNEGPSLHEFREYCKFLQSGSD
ncbi:MAG: hypothetical protein ACN4GM_13585 [Gammaproteobacteria bacterium]